jgi:hypothetical protein
MGDWQGTLQAPNGDETPLCAQVICWGRAGYQANLLNAFDRADKPIAVLRGKLTDAEVAFGDQARIAAGGFTGDLAGERPGRFRMAHVVRLSPTLGARPPAGAVVLFDGTSLDEWLTFGDEPWTINLATAIGGDDRAAYLRSRVWSPKAQPAMLELGSDDGVKAWVNGALVNANNTPRPLTPWEDRVNIELREGWNAVLLKVVQGGGGWGACARVRAPGGTDLPGLRFDPVPTLSEGVDLKAFQGDSTGTIVTWELAGPYTEEGKRGPALFDVPFPPETEGSAAVEWRIVNDKPVPERRWRLVPGGAMEITPGAGAIISKRRFRDQRVHVEFRTPFEPDARGQGRGNSGVYLQGRYEVQVLDSYGLPPESHECGGIYGIAAPLVNMCAPPLQWQTFDIEFHAARLSKEDNKVEDACMTVRHNGVLIHDDVRMRERWTGGQDVVAGALLLQDHGNPVQYRNIWVVEL